MAEMYPRRAASMILKDEDGKDSCVISAGLISGDGSLYLNDPAREVLLYCDGKANINDMVNKFNSKYTGSSHEEIKEGIVSTIEQLVEFGLVSLCDQPSPSCEIVVKKSLLSLELVYLELTRACNLRCIHCYNEAGVKREKELGTGDIIKIINILDDIGVIDIVLTGGEPFIRKDILEIIKEINRHKMRFSVFTNGIMLSPSIIDSLAGYDPRFVAISLDGADSKYDGLGF